MKIERVTAADAEELLAIYTPYVTDTAITFEYTVPSVEEFAERIRTISAKYPYIKAVENGQILGYAYAGAFHPRYLVGGELLKERTQYHDNQGTENRHHHRKRNA